MTKTNVLVLAAGAPQFISSNDNGYPSSLAEVGGHSLLELILEKMAGIEGANFIFALRDDEIDQFHLDQVVELLCPGARVMRIADGTQGSACSALMAACTIPADEEVLIVSANELVNVNFPAVLSSFREQGLDGGTLTFHSVHPRYSYVRLGNDDLISEVSQRRPISKHATTGTFWYARAEYLVDAIKQMIRKGDALDGRYYIAKTFNEMILAQKRIGVWKINVDQYHPLKSDRHLSQFEQLEAM
ncbi:MULTISPECIES: glycosyltransferase family 2 protein [Paraburkholderia]|uniref:Uncharacterized protein n=1 Tax=Paraburkholderia podalyriae TaxID=1938811 RepID=A0ABR7PYU6_9BURK|nr:glycosyltransferase family 2 protein [Paraburkholderia podalyriae]MBC8751449.1 hypothetical protein [Paraburkholderia podalyriae]